MHGVVSACLVALAVAAPASAQGYVRLSAGLAAPQDLSQTTAYCFCIALDGDSFPRQQTTRSATGYDLGAAAGWSFSDSLSVELEYRHLSSEIDTVVLTGGFSERLGPLTTVVGSTGRLSADTLLANTRLFLPNLDLGAIGRPAPFLRAGFGAARIDAAGQADTEGAAQLGLGLSWRMSDRHSFSVELGELRTGKLRYGPKAFTAFGPIGPRLTGGRYVADTLRFGFERRF